MKNKVKKLIIDDFNNSYGNQISNEQIMSKIDFSKKPVIEKKEKKSFFKTYSLVLKICMLILLIGVSSISTYLICSNTHSEEYGKSVEKILSKAEKDLLIVDNLTFEQFPIMNANLLDGDALIYIIKAYNVDRTECIYYYKAKVSRKTLTEIALIVNDNTIVISSDNTFGVITKHDKKEGIADTLDITFEYDGTIRQYIIKD